jgi:DNA modification methylase
MFVCGDTRKLPLSDETVQCAVTNPPYFQLRNYQCGGRQIGLEAAPEAYLAALIEVFRAVRRVLRPDGVLWLVLGDCYWGTIQASAACATQRSSQRI